MNSSKTLMVILTLICSDISRVALDEDFLSRHDFTPINQTHIEPSNSTWHELEAYQKLTGEEISKRVIHLNDLESYNQTHEFSQDSLLPNEESTKNHFKRYSFDEESMNSHEEDNDVPRAAALKISPHLSQSFGLRPHTRGSFATGHNFLENLTCAKCSRERNLCQIVSGIFTRSPLPYGYSLVTHIPAGICNITIVEIKPSKNFFAMRRKDNTYVLNGNWKIQAAGTYVIGGTMFVYTPSDGVIGEKLESSGPLKEPIDLMLIYQSPNPGIRYEYRIPFSASQTPPTKSTNKIYRTENIIPNVRGPPNGRHPGTSNNGYHTGRQGPYVSTGSYSYKGLPPSSSGLPMYPHGNNPSYGGPSNIPLSKNWGSYYPHQNVRPTAPIGHIPRPPSRDPSISREGSIDTSKKFQGGRYPEILNHVPEIITTKPVKIYNFAEVPSIHNVGNFSGVHNGVTNGQPLHRARHQHGQKNVYPGPSVTGSRNHIFSMDGYRRNIAKHDGKDTFINTLPNDEQSKHSHKKRRKKKKGRKRRDRYQWVFKGLTKCSSSCGGGNQTSVLSCEKKRKNKVVSDKRCSDIEKPEIKVVSCNLKPCPAEWVPGGWEPCSVTCGNGTKKRGLACKQKVSPTLTLMVHEGACQTPSKDTLTMGCHAGRCPTKEPYWRTGSWSPCAGSCSNGSRTRDVKCIVWLTIHDDAICNQAGLPKPIQTENCVSNSCNSNAWHFSNWSDECFGHCGNKKETRSVFCMAPEDKAEEMCHSDAKPATSRACQDKSGCNGLWFTGEWSDCSVSCGIGHESRPIECLALKDNRWRPAPFKDCERDTKPLETRECIQEKCSPKWYITEWSECSTTCGEGVKTREAKCLTTEANVSSKCLPELKPITTQKCNKTPCSSHPITEKKDKTSKHQNEKDVEAPSTKGSILDEDDLYDEESSTEDMDDEVSYEETSDIEHFDNTIDEDNIRNESEEPIGQDIEDNHINLIPRKDDPNKYSETTSSTENNGSEERKQQAHKTKKILSNCIDRIKNCQLVFRARLCRLKYYNNLCCATCK